jgi:putative transposase
MSMKRYKPEEIVGKLRQAEVLHSQGMSMAGAIRQLGISEVTCYRWRREYGGLSSERRLRARKRK